MLDAQRSQARNLHVAKSRRVAKSREAKPLSRVRRGGVGGLPLPGDAGIPGAPRSESRGGLWPRGALGAAVRGLAGAASPRLSTRHAAKRGGAASVLFSASFVFRGQLPSDRRLLRARSPGAAGALPTRLGTASAVSALKRFLQERLAEMARRELPYKALGFGGLDRFGGPFSTSEFRTSAQVCGAPRALADSRPGGAAAGHVRPCPGATGPMLRFT